MTEVINHIPLPPFDATEALRYMCVQGESPEEITELLASCLKECEEVLAPQVCAAIYDITMDDDIVDFGDFCLRSRDLVRCLKGCTRAVVFVATIGLGIDRLIIKYNRLSPARALAISAIGSERIEALCDAFSERLRLAHSHCSRRFSPGYGNLSLKAQTKIFAALNPTHHIGVTLCGTQMMTPVKSVSAIVGIGGECQTSHRCDTCNKTDCEFKIK